MLELTFKFHFDSFELKEIQI